jgi:hypothetical protein
MMVFRQHQRLFGDMECTVSRILITGYIDNELSDDEMQQLKAHLRTCENCVAHMHKMEHMKTVFKRYHLVQELPEASPNFARKVSRIIQDTVTPERRPSLFLRGIHTYRSYMLRLAESWINSLKARPVTWATSVSCLLILLTGVVLTDITRTTLQSPLYSIIPSIEQAPPSSEGHQSVAVLMREEEGRDVSSSPPVLLTALERDADTTEEAGLPAFIQFSDDAVVQIAKTDTEPVVSYVYSHIVEASQEQFLDNAVFASYVQDALF